MTDKINEEYVSFETAKLLKERRFDDSCFYVWVKSSTSDIPSLKATVNFVEGEITTNRETLDVVTNSVYIYDMYTKVEAFLCPSLQKACKWLRLIHNLNVEVYRTACGYIGCIVTIPSGTDIKFLEDNGDDLASGQYTTWEKACEAAIKYCLEKLIK